MSAFRIERINKGSDTYRVRHGAVSAAIIFPADPDGSRAVYPHPTTYPGLNFTGLPAPLEPRWMRFPSLEAVSAFLGIEEPGEIAA